MAKTELLRRGRPALSVDAAAGGIRCSSPCGGTVAKDPVRTATSINQPWIPSAPSAGPAARAGALGAGGACGRPDLVAATGGGSVRLRAAVCPRSGSAISTAAVPGRGDALLPDRGRPRRRGPGRYGSWSCAARHGGGARRPAGYIVTTPLGVSVGPRIHPIEARDLADPPMSRMLFSTLSPSRRGSSAGPTRMGSGGSMPDPIFTLFYLVGRARRPAEGADSNVRRGQIRRSTRSGSSSAGRRPLRRPTRRAGRIPRRTASPAKTGIGLASDTAR
jgi:hypothetical protein